jgi:uncharacterized linocin/CFP29 family protein
VVVKKHDKKNKNAKVKKYVWNEMEEEWYQCFKCHIQNRKLLD